MKKTIVVIPTYNEKSNISELIKEINLLNLDVLVVDDNSEDGTSKIVENLPSFKVNLFLIKRPQKLGLGSAYRDGFTWSIKNGYKHIIEMDADLSHSVNDLKKMLNFKETHGLVIGSRYVTGGKILGWSKKRYWLSVIANKFSKFLTFSYINDMTSGFRIYSLDSLKKINYLKTKSNGYAFQIEMTIKALNSEISIIEVPICFNERKAGKSKMSYLIIFEAMINVFKFSFMRLRYILFSKY